MRPRSISDSDGVQGRILRCSPGNRKATRSVPPGYRMPVESDGVLYDSQCFSTGIHERYIYVGSDSGRVSGRASDRPGKNESVAGLLNGGVTNAARRRGLYRYLRKS